MRDCFVHNVSAFMFFYLLTKHVTGPWVRTNYFPTLPTPLCPFIYSKEEIEQRKREPKEQQHQESLKKLRESLKNIRIDIK